MLDIVPSIPDSLTAAYSRLLLSKESTLFYQNPKYHRHVCEHLDCESLYFLWHEEDQVQAAFPFLIKKHPEFGAVFNSLPYYGSNGGFVFNDDLSIDRKKEIMTSFLETVESIYAEHSTCLSTIVTNPFEAFQSDWFKLELKYDYTDHRIGQITPLPEETQSTEETLINSFSNPRPRNIRRALKARITVRRSTDLESLEFLYKVHKDNIESIGGKAKRWSFFERIPANFNEDEFSVYIASKDGIPVSGLLLFYFNKTVEYFTPATLHDYRNDQPSALLILEAMKESVSLGYKFWNWGGTWKSQEGVYDFKKRWGAEDHNYHYYVRVLDKNVLACSIEELSEAFPNFYLYPY